LREAPLVNKKKRKLIIVGDSAFAEVAYEYFTHDSDFDVVAFAVERAFLRKETLLGLPVVSLESLTDDYKIHDHSVFIAIAYTQLNRLRTRLLDQVIARGYTPASYVSSRAFVWRNVKLGPHCFIMENNVVQPFATVGRNVVLWSGNHIGHHSTIGDNVFIASHVVISGLCNIGANSFLGVNVTIANNVSVAEDCWISSGVTLMADTRADEVYGATSGTVSNVGARRLNKVRTTT
jgi:sugar O-acyltransferase (sialic acid O-acetyltransferase NeuD family)